MDFPALLLAAPDGAAAIPLSMLVVFASAKLVAEIFERFGQPGIVGEILAGVLIGPYVLGWLAPNETLTMLAELGVMFLLFRVGLEVRSSDLVRVGGTATAVAVLGVAAPFALGWGILTLWGEARIEAIFAGAAMVATSVGITAQVLRAKGLLEARAARIILAAAVIDDVLGLLVLAIVSSMARGSVNVAELAITAAMAIGFTVAVALLGARAMKRLSRVPKRMAVAEAEYALAITLLFALSLLSVYAGVAAIIGAFLAGMALSETVDHRVHELTNGVTELLVPFFLVGVGLHLNITAFNNASNIMLGLLILVAAVLSKLIGCGLGAWPLGRADAFRVGAGMVPRGEVGMVVAQIGLGLGVVSQHVYGIIVFMSVATTLIAPPMLKAAFRGLAGKPAGGPPAVRIG